VLEALTREQPLTTFELASKIYEGRKADGWLLFTEAQLVAVRRALLALEREGKVTGLFGFRNGRQRWFIKGSDQEQAELASRAPAHRHHWVNST
jgi:hypothetical protein